MKNNTEELSNVEIEVLSMSKEELETARKQIVTETIHTDFGDMLLVTHPKLVNKHITVFEDLACG